MLPAPFDQLCDAAIRNRSCAPHETVFSQGKNAVAIYYLVSGEVHLLRFGKDGTKVMIHRAHAGELFAEASLFSTSYHCDAIAQVECHLLRLDKRQILRQMQSNPKFSVALTAHLAHQVQAYRRLLEIRSIRSAPERVLSAVDARSLDGGIKAFVSEFGLTHEATYRALARLVKNRKLIKTGRGQYQRIVRDHNSRNTIS